MSDAEEDRRVGLESPGGEVGLLGTKGFAGLTEGVGSEERGYGNLIHGEGLTEGLTDGRRLLT